MFRFNNWRFWIGLGISVFFLLVLAYTIDLNETLDALRNGNYLLVAPAIGLYFVAVYFRSVRWRFLLSPLQSLPVTRLYPVVIIGYMSNNLLPARLGELVRSYYLAQREGVSGSSALATIAVERVYDGVALLAFAVLSAPLLLALGAFDNTSDAYRTAAIIVALAAVAIFLIALTFLTLATSPGFGGFIEKVLGAVPARFRHRLRGLVWQFLEGLAILNSPRKQGAVCLLSLPVWLMEGSMYLLVSYAFGIDAYFHSFGVLLLVTLLVTATSNLATAVPASVGGIGPFEVAAQQTLVALGVGAPVAAAYSGFLHVVALWLPVNLVGLALLWKYHLSLGKLIGGDLPGGTPTVQSKPAPANPAPANPAPANPAPANPAPDPGSPSPRPQEETL